MRECSTLGQIAAQVRNDDIRGIVSAAARQRDDVIEARAPWIGVSQGGIDRFEANLTDPAIAGSDHFTAHRRACLRVASPGSASVVGISARIVPSARFATVDLSVACVPVRFAQALRGVAFLTTFDFTGSRRGA